MTMKRIEPGESWPLCDCEFCKAERAADAERGTTRVIPAWVTLVVVAFAVTCLAGLLWKLFRAVSGDW